MMRNVFRWAALATFMAACAAGTALVACAADDGKAKQNVAAKQDAATDPKKEPDCVYVPTPHDVTAKMLEMAQVKKTDMVYDPGCGDGRLCVTAAKKYGCKAIGFEIVPTLVEQAKKNAKRRNVDHLVSIEKKDIFKLDYSQANVLTLYLLPPMLEKLLPSFEKMAPGSRIVAHDYELPGIVPDEQIEMVSKEDNDKHFLYSYKLPLRRAAASPAAPPAF
jgi:SAM-dependent methyltransferase